jgi:hypothetical protein
MAESNHRSYRDPAAVRSAPMPPDQPDYPLAELARLLAQTLPMNGLRPTPVGDRSAREFNGPARHGYAAPDGVLQETSEEQYSTPEQSSYDFDPPNDTHNDGCYEPLPRADASRQPRSAWYEHEPQSHSDAEDLHVESSGAGYDEYEDQSHDQPDDRAYGEDYEEDSNPRRRGGFIFVAAVFGLALLGTGGAFTYRALLADSIVPPPLSIIKAESGPNKIITTASQGSVPPQPDADKADSSGKERPVDVPPPVSTAPQPVATAPIFPESAPAPGPGAASVFPPTPLAQPAPVARVDSLNSPPAAPAPPIPSANQAAAPDAPTPTPASPTKPGPKKIRTVSIRTDQPNAADSAAGQLQSVPVRPTAQQQATKPSDANAPLSIVPSSNDAATAAAGSARTAPPARPAPVGKPAATEIASRARAASDGGYAVQVLSQRNEEEVQSSFRALQAKYPKLLGGREPMVRRADLGAKGVYYRAMVGPFVSAEQANELCSSLKAGGGNCIVQKN